MEVYRSRAFRAIRDAERELNNALRSLGEEDYSGALKYLQECSEYAVKAVLVAYGLDYPKVHEVGRFLVENRRMFPAWFKSRVEAIGETADMLLGIGQGSAIRMNMNRRILRSLLRKSNQL